jgi:DNA-binding IclR family transcriptional regulator
MNAVSPVKSATRILDLLETLATAAGPMGVSEVARRMGIPKSSAHSLLQTLALRSYAVCDDERRFSLHPMFGRDRGAWVGGSRGALLATARKPMASLARKTRETVFLAVPRDDRSLEYIEKIQSPQEVRCDAELHVPRALHSNTAGLVMLANAGRARIEDHLCNAELARFTPKTICGREALRKELEAVRRRGYATTRDSNTVGVSGVSAPVFDAQGGVVAAINVAVPTMRFNSLVKSLAREVVAAAERISSDLSEWR